MEVQNVFKMTVSIKSSKISCKSYRRFTAWKAAKDFGTRES